MGTLVINYADSNLPTFITTVVEVAEPSEWDSETPQSEKDQWVQDQIQSNITNGSNGAPRVFVFSTRKD